MALPHDDTIEIIAGTPPGGGQDRAARALAAALERPVEVTNVPGRGGGNAWDVLAGRAGEAAVVSISSPTLITNRELGIAHIDDRDLTPLAHLCTEYLAFVVAADAGIESADQVLGRLAGGRVVSAIATERGNVNHIALARVVRAAGAEPSESPIRVFDSARHAVSDLLEGAAQLAVVSAASTLPEFLAGSVRVVAMSAGARMSPPFEAIPTWSELGIDCVIGTWRGVVGPPEMPRDAIEAWDDVIRNAVGTDTWHESIRRYRWADTYLDRAALAAFLAGERVALLEGLEGLGLRGSGRG